MVLIAQVFRIGPVEHDLLHTLGLALAAVLLGILAFRHARSPSARRPRLVATLALVALVVVVWAAAEALVRLCAALGEQWGRNPSWGRKGDITDFDGVSPKINDVPFSPTVRIGNGVDEAQKAATGAPCTIRRPMNICDRILIINYLLGLTGTTEALMVIGGGFILTAGLNRNKNDLFSKRYWVFTKNVYNERFDGEIRRLAFAGAGKIS